MATSFSDGGSRRELPTMGRQLVKLITCGCESSAPFFVIYKNVRESTPYWWQACVSCYVIQLPNSLSHPGPQNMRKIVICIQILQRQIKSQNIFFYFSHMFNFKIWERKIYFSNNRRKTQLKSLIDSNTFVSVKKCLDESVVDSDQWKS